MSNVLTDYDDISSDFPFYKPKSIDLKTVGDLQNQYKDRTYINNPYQKGHCLFIAHNAVYYYHETTELWQKIYSEDSNGVLQKDVFFYQLDDQNYVLLTFKERNTASEFSKVISVNLLNGRIVRSLSLPIEHYFGYFVVQNNQLYLSGQIAGRGKKIPVDLTTLTIDIEAAEDYGFGRGPHGFVNGLVSLLQCKPDEEFGQLKVELRFGPEFHLNSATSPVKTFILPYRVFMPFSTMRLNPKVISFDTVAMLGDRQNEPSDPFGRDVPISKVYWPISEIDNWLASIIEYYTGINLWEWD